MPAGRIYRSGFKRHNYFIRTRGNPNRRRMRLVGRKIRGRKARIPRGLQPLKVPMRVGYTYDIIGTGASFVNFDQDLGLNKAPQSFLDRYEPIFSHIRINKCHISITCPYSIGQHGIGTQSLYQMWYKKAFSTAEGVPNVPSDWLNMQSAKRKIFSGQQNKVDLYFTPGFEEVLQPLNLANTSLKILYKQWCSLRPLVTEMTPHIGFIGQITRCDGSIIGNTNVFKVNVTLYCELRGIKEL